MGKGRLKEFAQRLFEFRLATGTHVALNSNSVMEYNAGPSDIFWHQTWGNQDKGAISWIYGNARNPSTGVSTSASAAFASPVRTS